MRTLRRPRRRATTNGIRWVPPLWVFALSSASRFSRGFWMRPARPGRRNDRREVAQLQRPAQPHRQAVRAAALAWLKPGFFPDAVGDHVVIARVAAIHALLVPREHRVRSSIRIFWRFFSALAIRQLYAIRVPRDKLTRHHPEFSFDCDFLRLARPAVDTLQSGIGISGWRSFQRYSLPKPALSRAWMH